MHTPSSNSNSSSRFGEMAEMLPPNREGIQRVVNVLQNSSLTCGTVAYPTESSYVLACNARSEDSVNALLTKLRPSSADNCNNDEDRIKRSRFTMHLPSANEARGHFSFRPSRKYAYRKPLCDNNSTTGGSQRLGSTDSSQSSSSNTSYTECANTCSSNSSHVSHKLVYCKLSEGREVFERLADAFWPGALTIVANATWKSMGENHKLLFDASKEATSFRLGVRCPSHPLAQCILKESNTPVFVAENSHNLFNANDVFKEQVLVKKHNFPDSDPTLGLDDLDNGSDKEPSILCIVNGEDKREIFTVPTCDLAGEPTVVEIDDEHSRVIILKRGVGPSKERIQRALTQLPGDIQNISNSQLITTALIRKKWKVIECLDAVEEEEVTKAIKRCCSESNLNEMGFKRCKH